MKQKLKRLEKDFNHLKDRIFHHRQECSKWPRKPCYDCHKNTLTKIETELWELRYET